MDYKVQRMSYESQGVYLKILSFMWMDSPDQSSIEDHDRNISKALGISMRKWTNIRAQFLQNQSELLTTSVKNNIKTLHSSRLYREAEKQRNYRELKSKAGKKGMTKRWHADNSVITDPITDPITEHNSSSSSSSSSSSEKLKNKEYIYLAEQRFEALKKAYPKKNGKLIGITKAKDRFMALSEANQVQCVASAANYEKCEKVGGGFITEFFKWVTDHSNNKRYYHWQDWIEPERREPPKVDLNY